MVFVMGPDDIHTSGDKARYYNLLVREFWHRNEEKYWTFRELKSHYEYFLRWLVQNLLPWDYVLS